MIEHGSSDIDRVRSYEEWPGWTGGERAPIVPGSTREGEQAVGPFDQTEGGPEQHYYADLARAESIEEAAALGPEPTFGSLEEAAAAQPDLRALAADDEPHIVRGQE